VEAEGAEKVKEEEAELKPPPKPNNKKKPKKREAEAAKRREEQKRAAEEEARRKKVEEDTRKKEEEARRKEEEELRREEEMERRSEEERVRRVKEEEMKRDADKRRRAEETKRQQEEMRKKIEETARMRQKQEEAQTHIIEEKAMKEREAIESQQRATQNQMREMEQAILRQKDEALSLLEKEKRDRARREQLWREHDASLALQAPRPPKRTQVVPPRPQPPVQRRRIAQGGRPFEPEDATDEAVLNEYLSRPAPDASLPTVPFVKRNGTYWLGGRRCNIDFDGDRVLVKLGGNDTEYFSSWIEKVERVEALRLKGLISAQTIITLYQAVGSRSRVPVKINT